MTETTALEDSPISLKEIYQNSNYISLYRYENPNLPYPTNREGTTSKEELVGFWYTDNLDDLKSYVSRKIQGQKGGRFVVVRIKKSDLDKYDARKLQNLKDMDTEEGNFIIPDEVGKQSRLEVDALFKDSWEGKKNIPLSDYADIEEYISKNLSHEAILARIRNI